MLFTELRFLLFFFLLFAIYWGLPTNRGRKLFLILGSYGFYAGWDWRFLSLILASTLVDYTTARIMGRIDDKSARKPYLIISLVANLGILSFFKYYNFFVDSARAFTARMGLDLPVDSLDIILPIGISFYTFQTLSYSIDVYRGRLESTKSLVDVSLFVAFFPQLVAGPIVRAGEFLPQLLEKRRFQDVDLRHHLTLFLAGFIKKACIADRIAPIIDPVFAADTTYSVASHWLAAMLYSVQIYCDFSGYTDMAIACAGLLGYQLTRNFDYPYTARNIQDFWRRWHISLTTWFRDYVFLPMSFSALGRRSAYAGLLVVWALVGLWHGAGWNFVLWGAYHGLLISAYRLTRPIFVRVQPKGRIARASWAFAGWATTYGLILAGLVLFRSADLSSTFSYLRTMAGSQLAAAAAPVAEISAGWCLLLGSFAIAHFLFARKSPMAIVKPFPGWVFSLGYGAAVALSLPWAAWGYEPFIYFQF